MVVLVYLFGAYKTIKDIKSKLAGKGMKKLANFVFERTNAGLDRKSEKLIAMKDDLVSAIAETATPDADMVLAHAANVLHIL